LAGGGSHDEVENTNSRPRRWTRRRSRDRILGGTVAGVCGGRADGGLARADGRAPHASTIGGARGSRRQCRLRRQRRRQEPAVPSDTTCAKNVATLLGGPPLGRPNRYRLDLDHRPARARSSEHRRGVSLKLGPRAGAVDGSVDRVRPPPPTARCRFVHLSGDRPATIGMPRTRKHSRDTRRPATLRRCRRRFAVRQARLSRLRQRLRLAAARQLLASRPCVLRHARVGMEVF
jgi:hypothetical protein